MGWVRFLSVFLNFQVATVFADDPKKIVDQVMDINKSKLPCQVDPKMSYVCDSMSTFSCKPGSFEDGTGRALSDDDFQKKIAPMQAKINSIYEKSILNVLQNKSPQFDLVRDLAVKATRQDGTPGCESEKISERKDCFKRIASILASRKVRAEIGFMNHSSRLPSPPKRSGEFDFESLGDLYSNGAYRAATDEAHKEALKVVKQEKLERKIEKEIFPRVRELIVQKINDSVPDPEMQKKISKKLMNIRFDGVDCSSSVMEGHDDDDGSIPGLLLSNAFYNPNLQVFRFCNGLLLRNSSEFSIAMVVAHELAHSIDPCNIQKPSGAAPLKYNGEGRTHPEIEEQFPIKGLVSCLRTKESIGAARVGENETIRAQELPFCGSNEQIREGFADWMGAEVLGKYIDQHHAGLSPSQKLVGYSNVFRNFSECNEDAKGFNTHPPMTRRIDRVIMANPEIRGQIGCPAASGDLHYCKAGEKFNGTRVVVEPEKDGNPRNHKSSDQSPDSAPTDPSPAPETKGEINGN